jgi:hypothetical protein
LAGGRGTLVQEARIGELVTNNLVRMCKLSCARKIAAIKTWQCWQSGKVTQKMPCFIAFRGQKVRLPTLPYGGQAANFS